MDTSLATYVRTCGSPGATRGYERHPQGIRELEPAAHDYLYAGFRDPIQRISGDAYRSLCALRPHPTSGAKQREVPDRDALIHMYRAGMLVADIAAALSVAQPTASYRIKRLVRDGELEPRKIPSRRQAGGAQPELFGAEVA